MHAGLAAVHAEDELFAATEADLEHARELVDAGDTVLASGRLVDKAQRIVVGVGGSPASRGAEAAARSLAERLTCEVMPVVSLDGDVDTATLRAEREHALLEPRRLPDAVVAASSDRSLVVVGRDRGHVRRRGADLGERITYAARCSVLVVRPQADGAR